MRSRGLLAFAVVVAALAAAGWFAWRGGGEGSAATARRAAARAPEADAAAEGASGAPHEAAPAPDAAPQRAVEPAAAARRIFGRIVDARRFGVAGARVRFTADGRTPVEATSREGGAFEFAFASVGAKFLLGALLATGPDGALGEGLVALGPDRADGSYDEAQPRDFDAGVLALLPPARIVVHVSDDHGPVEGAEVCAESSGFGWATTTARLPAVTSDANGVAVLSTPRCDATVIATVPGRATARTWTTCESGVEQTIELVLHSSISVTIRVRDAQTGGPVANARVVLGERLIARQNRDSGFILGPELMGGWGHLPDLVCDADGVAHLDDVDPEQQWMLRARAPRYDAAEGSSAKLDASSRDVELRLTPSGSNELRLPIVADEVPVPADGTVVALRPRSDSSGAGLPDQAKVERGELVIADAPKEWHAVTATAPDGALASFGFNNPRSPQEPVRFKKPRTLELHLRFADGRAAARTRVQIGYGSGATDGLQADDEGQAVRRGLLAWRVRVYPEGAYSMLTPLAEADLREGDARLDVVVPERYEAVLAVTIDGRPGLPPTYRVGSNQLRWKIESEDPERGEVRTSSLAGATEATVEAWFAAASFLPAKLDVPVVRGGAPPVVPVALVRGATLRLDAKRAKEQKFGLWIQRQGDDGKFANLPEQFRAMDRLNGANGLFEFAPLAAGSWRVLDEVTQLASEPVVLATGEERTASLDLSGAVVIRGRITVPAGTDFKDVRVVARGEPAEIATDRFARPTYPGTFVRPDFTFERTVDGAKPFVRAWHPSLTPPPGDPFVEVRDATRPVELALVDRPALAFTVVRTGGAITPSQWDLNEHLSITLEREDGDRARVTRSPATSGAATEVVHLSEIPAGRWTLRLDPGGDAAPVTRTGVEIAESGTDLGPLELGPGSVLRLQIADGRANRSGDLGVHARHVGAPEYSRFLHRAAGPELLLPGLGPGKFEISISDSTGKPLWTGTAEVDGAHETALAVDLR